MLVRSWKILTVALLAMAGSYQVSAQQNQLGNSYLAPVTQSSPTARIVPVGQSQEPVAQSAAPSLGSIAESCGCSTSDCSYGERIVIPRPSESCFDSFISPISNPVFFEDPRNLT